MDVRLNGRLALVSGSTAGIGYAIAAALAAEAARVIINGRRQASVDQAAGTIKPATGGKRSLGDFLKALGQQAGDGVREYEWRDIPAALDATAPLDWETFYRAYIRGDARLPLDNTFALAGLRIDDAADAVPRVAIDPAAPARAQAVWQGLVHGQ